MQSFRRIVAEKDGQVQIEWEDGELEWMDKEELRECAPDAVEDWEEAEEPEPLIIGTDAELKAGVGRLADLLKAAKREAKVGEIVFHVGAGISTAAGVPDFRGPNGLWTSSRPDALPEIASIEPSYTHRAMVALHRHGFINHVVSQNYDCLLLKAGFPAEHLSEIHGNLFVERCDDCDKEWMRDFAVENEDAKKHETGRLCEDCNGVLRDTIIHFGEQLNDRESAEKHSKAAILSVAMGTKLSVTPASEWALDIHQRRRKRGKKTNGGDNDDGQRHVVLVNVQKTGQEDRCDLVIQNYVDIVMKQLLKVLKIEVE